MGKGIWRLEVRGEFSASHQLRNYNGKCEQMHGHNFGVCVAVEGKTLTEDTQLLVDFKVLKTHLREIVEDLDHHHINEVPPFTEQNPTSENLARYIYQAMAQRLGNLPAKVVSVSVSEKPAQTAIYREED